jgi:hypothetical protein
VRTRLLFAFGLTCVACATYAAHSPRVLADRADALAAHAPVGLIQHGGTVEGAWQMYDPSGTLKGFKLNAHPEACIGTPESIQATGRATVRQIGPLAISSPLRLIPEPVPPGTPLGWRGFRFTDSKRVFLGTVCGVVRDQETGHVVFVMSDTSPQTHSKQASFTTRQDELTPFESHILIPPNGYVSPELIVSDSTTSEN